MAQLGHLLPHTSDPSPIKVCLDESASYLLHSSERPLTACIPPPPTTAHEYHKSPASATSTNHPTRPICAHTATRYVLAGVWGFVRGVPAVFKWCGNGELTGVHGLSMVRTRTVVMHQFGHTPFPCKAHADPSCLTASCPPHGAAEHGQQAEGLLHAGGRERPRNGRHRAEQEAAVSRGARSTGGPHQNLGLQPQPVHPDTEKRAGLTDHRGIGGGVC